MKHILLIALATVVGLTDAVAQKFGHLDTQEILRSLPEVAAAEQQLQKLQAEFEEQIETMMMELQTKQTEFQEKGSTWPSAIRQQKELEYSQLAQGLQDFQMSAENEIAQKQQELFLPIDKKLQEAIKAVGEEHGFIYIFSSNIGVTLYEGGEDVSGLVKTKLGI